MTDVLTFDQIEPERAYVRIGDNRYQLALPDDLGLVALARLDRMRKLWDSFSADDVEDNPAEADKLHRMLRDGLRMVLPAFTDRECEYVAGECAAGHVLNDRKMLSVIEAFSAEAKRAAAPPPNRKARRKSPRSTRRIGAKSSRASAVSTASGTG